MSTSSQNLDIIFFDEDEAGEPPTLERLEELLRVLRHCGEAEAPGAQEPPALPGDFNAVEEDLKNLRIGSAAPDWDEGVREVWAAFEGRWASRSAAEGLEASLATLLEPLRRQGSAVGDLTAELSLAEARVATLRVLADILDELTCSPAIPAETNGAEGD